MLERRHLRDQLRDAIRDRIVTRRLPPGQSVGEVALAEELGVSRTPVREALLGLERDGFVKSVPGRGFVVSPLSADEARELYPIVWSLEKLAIGEAAEVDTRLIRQLRDINARMASATDPKDRARRDAEWHRALVSVSSNTRLLAFLEGVKSSLSRYEHAYLDIPELRDRSVEEHEHIAALLEQSPKRAAEAVEAHFRRGLDTILATIAKG